MKKTRILGLLTAAAMVTSMLPTWASAADSSGDFKVTGSTSVYSYTDGILTLTAGGTYTVEMNTEDGATSTERIVIDSSGDVTLTLKGVNITSSADSPLRVDSGNVTLILDGDNSLISKAENYPGLTKESENYTLTITSSEGDGSSKGSLTATGATYGAGIGGGNGCSGNNIIINGGTITATGGDYGAGIGGGNNGGNGSGITITGGTVDAKGGDSGAGIGGGRSGSGSNITISGGAVDATAGESAAGIGGGRSGNGSNITISGGTVNATAGDYGAGIGGGRGLVFMASVVSGGKGNDIAISGGYITLTKGTGAEYIGYGSDSSSENITVTGGYFGDSGFTAGVGTSGMVYGVSLSGCLRASANTDSATSSDYPCVVTNHRTFTNGFCDDCGAYEQAVLNDDGVYEISNAGQFYWFAALVNGDTTQDGITAADIYADAILTADIDLGETTATHTDTEWTPIGKYNSTYTAAYKGTFDGDNHTVKGLKITTAGENISLFGYVMGTVKNLTVYGEVNVSGGTVNAGGIVGVVKNGTLSHLTSYVNVTGNTTTKGGFGGVAAAAEGDDGTAGSTVEYCVNYGTVTASGTLDCVAGVVGYLHAATINSCANIGTVDTSGATAQYKEGVYTGGISGYCNNEYSVITNCYNYGTITAASAALSTDNYTGAIIGRINANVGNVANSYYLAASATAGCGANGSSFDADSAITSKSANAFANGEVAYLLQNGENGSGWGQDLTTDTYPTIDGDKVIKLTINNAGSGSGEYYINSGKTFTSYPTPSTGKYAFYTDSSLTNRINTSTYTFTADTTLYAAQVYTITQHLTHVTSSYTASEIASGTAYSATLTAAEDCALPESITVTVGGTALTAGTDYTYDSTTGAIAIAAASITDNVVITAVGTVIGKVLSIDEVTIGDGTIDVAITNTTGDTSGVLIVAVYTSDGAFAAMKTVNLADITDSVSIAVDTANAAYVSAFIWDSTAAMTPLCAGFTTK